MYSLNASNKYWFLIGILFMAFACKDKTNAVETPIKDKNPAAEGFILADSDPEAIVIADEVMEKMGGREKWDETRYIAWDFFGARFLIWDKWTGNVRLDSEKSDYIVLLNIHDLKGKVKLKGEELTHPDSLKKYIKMGHEAWINDSYWLVMPFKLKDSGVILKYSRKDTTDLGTKADVLTLTFKDTGVTPNNKYEVFVEETSRLIHQWTFYANATDEKARFSTPWLNYKKHGSILLSGDRGGDYQLKDIGVYKDLPETVFTSFDPVSLDQK